MGANSRKPRPMDVSLGASSQFHRHLDQNGDSRIAQAGGAVCYHPHFDAATAHEGNDNTQGIDVQLGRGKQRQITISKLNGVKND